MPSIATLYAEVLPETSKIAAGIVSSFRKVDPEAREAGRRWGREIQQGLGEAKVELKADTAKAKAEIDEAAKDKKATVEVDADTAKAEAQIDIAARDRIAHVRIDTDALADSGAQAAPRVAGSLSAAMAPVGGALSTALLVGGVTAAAGVAAALSGAIALIPAGLGGGVAVLGTLVTGLDGVKNAWDAAGKAADSATKDQAAKAKEVASAQKTLRDAVMDEATAQKDVANARKDARIQLEDLNVQLRGGVIDEKSAILDAQAARRDLATGRFKDSIEYQQAQLRVQQADQRVLEAHERNVDLQNKATDANAKGVDQSDQVVAANQRLAKAHDDVAGAQRNLADAQKPSSNQQSLIESMAKLSPVAQGFVNTLVGLKPAWQSLKFGVQDSLLAGIGPELQALTMQYLPTLKSAMGGLAGTMNTAFKGFGDWLSKPETLATIQQIIANIGTSFQEWSKSIVPFSQAFLTITQVGSGLLPGLAKMITDGANAFNDFIQKASRTGELSQWMQLGIDTMRELMRLVPVLGKLFMDLAPMAIPALQLIGQFVRAIEPAIQPVVAVLATMTAALAQHPGLIQAVVVAFGTWKAISAVSTVLTGLEAISAALTAIPAEAELAGAGITAGLGPLLAGLATAAALLNLGGDSGPTNIGQGADEHQRKLNAGKAYADAHGGKVPDGYQQWLDSKGPMPKDLDKYYVQGAAPGTPFYDAQGRPLNAQGKPFSGATGLPGPYIPNMPPSTVPGALATPPAGASGYNWDALAQAEAGGNWANKSNPKYMGGLQFDQQTWNAYKAPDAPPNAADATKEQQIAAANNAIAAGRTPQSLWPQNWQKLGAAAGAPSPSASAGAAPSGVMPSIPSTGAVLPPVVAPGGGATSPNGFPLNAPEQAFSINGFSTQLAQGGGGQRLAAFAQWFNDNIEPVKELAGYDAGGHGLGNQSNHTSGTALDINWSDFTALQGHGADATTHFGPDKMAAIQQALSQFGLTWGQFWTPDSRDPGHFELGGASYDKNAAANRAALGGTPNFGGMYPSAAGMPTIASPQGVSPDGTPLGTQQSPMYVSPAGGSGGQQLGQDIFSGFLEIFGIDGSVFKNPFGGGLFQGFKGLMSALTGGGRGGGQGLPASAWAAQGGDGAALPPMGGGGGIGGILQGMIPQPFGQITPGGPMQAPDEYQPMLPGSGGNTGMPSNFLAPARGETPTGPGHKIDNSTTYVLNGTPPPGSHDFLNGVNTPRARQSIRGLP